MRMSRRAFSQAAATAQPGPAGQYTVYLWSIPREEPFDNGSFLDGVYGVYAVGEVVDVELYGIREIFTISSVVPYDFSLGDSIECTWIDDLRVQFAMPAFDVTVNLETI